MLSRTVAAKFGGSSLADAGCFEKVKRIIEADPARRFIVVSAPGKRSRDDIKITDSLIACVNAAREGREFAPFLETVKQRFHEIALALNTDFDAETEFQTINQLLSVMPYEDYALSRGEYLSAKLMAKYLGFEFVDAASCVKFDEYGILDEETTVEALRFRLKDLPGAVLPGFYGSLPSGAVKTFSRGGSDISGALVAAAVRADVYENWTDVSGLLAADPRIVPNPKTVDIMSYRELRVLSYMGASVLHTDAVKPVESREIPINIRNTFMPEAPGTLIVSKLPVNREGRAITGVAGRKGMSVVQVEKNMVSDGAGFTALLLDLFRARRLPFEQCLTGIDTISVVVRTDLLAPRRQELLGAIRTALNPDTLMVKDNLSMIAVVGEDVPSGDDCTTRIINALYAGGIPVSTLNRGAGSLNLILGVPEEYYVQAINAVYAAIPEGGKK